MNNLDDIILTLAIDYDIDEILYALAKYADSQDLVDGSGGGIGDQLSAIAGENIMSIDEFYKYLETNL